METPVTDQELRNASVFTGITASAYFLTGLIAARYWLISVPRFAADDVSLKTRRLLLQILSLANVLRASSLVIYAYSFDLQWRKHMHHKRMALWIAHFDTLVLSFPSMLWDSMLCVLIVFIVEIHSRTRMHNTRLLRSQVLALNISLYAAYGLVFFSTLWSKDYELFTKAAYILTGSFHLLLILPLVWYGCHLWRTLKQRESSPFLAAGSSNGLINRVAVLSTMLPMLEVTRGTYDFYYFFKGSPPISFGGKFERLAFIAFMRLGLEWTPSVVLLYAFRPLRESDRRCGSPLVSPQHSLQNSIRHMSC